MSLESLLSMERFSSKASFGPDHWIWKGAKDGGGYGQFWYNGKKEKVHRLVYRLSNGVDPGEFVVLHKCDIPACFNPDCLSLGTQADNVKDMIKKGRHRPGKGWMPHYKMANRDTGNGKLTRDDIARAIEMRRSGMSSRMVGRIFGVAHTTILREAKI